MLLTASLCIKQKKQLKRWHVAVFSGHVWCQLCVTYTANGSYSSSFIFISTHLLHASICCSAAIGWGVGSSSLEKKTHATKKKKGNDWQAPNGFMFHLPSKLSSSVWQIIVIIYFFSWSGCSESVRGPRGTPAQMFSYSFWLLVSFTDKTKTNKQGC